MALFKRKSHFEISSDIERLRRGEEVEATLAITDPEKVGDDLKVGLVCDELYAYEDRQMESDGPDRVVRQTASAVAFEDWQPATSSDPMQTFRFRVPADAPFSHEGDTLKFRWTISARDAKRMRLDPKRDKALEVLP